MREDRLSFPDPTHVEDHGQRLVYFGGCDYLRLAWDPRTKKAAEKGLHDFPLSVGASRLTTGNLEIYREIEDRLSQFFGFEACSLTSSGYTANLVLAQALRGHVDRCFIDEMAHGSLQDAAALMGCEVQPFRHTDAHHLHHLFKRTRKGLRSVVMTDGLFGAAGALAPLRDYRAVVGPKTPLWIDDAHGAGVLGPTGKGTLELSGLDPEGVIVTATLSKAFGSTGGLVLSRGHLKEGLFRNSRIFAQSTALAPAALCAAEAALEIIKQGDPRARLKDRIAEFNRILARRGSPRSQCISPITSLVLMHTQSCREADRHFRERGLFPSLIRYPPTTAHTTLRFALSSEHSPEQIRDLAEAILRWRENAGAAG